MPDSQLSSFDVVILGGGICGLALALQLRQRVPDVSVAVVEKSRHPVNEATHKVGESTVEVQAHYLRDVLGIEDHLNEGQLRKFGLRLFFSYDGNADIAKRVEYGQIRDAPLSTYQLDRGRLENELGRRATDAGATFLTGTKVVDVELGNGQDRHVVTVDAGGDRRELSGRWVVDASGRASTLKRKLGLQKPLPHEANASWFRIEYPIDVQTWSDDPDWLARVPSGKRRLSTNHLMGEGYWVWLIPLASGFTSVGIVSDANIHPFHTISTFEKTLDFLRTHEPQCAAQVIEHRDLIRDFRAMKDYSYSCQQVYSTQRWALTGEAGVSIDPFYSSGGDLMAISNGLITDLIERDHRDEDISVVTGIHDKLYLLLSDLWLLLYQDQFPVMGNAQVMVAKVLWDTTIYWAVPGLLCFHDRMRRMLECPEMLTSLVRVRTVQDRVQQFFREWAAVDNPVVSAHFANPYEFEYVKALHIGMAAGLSDEDFLVQLERNVDLLDQWVGQLAATVIDSLSESHDAAVIAQVAKWREDELIAEYIDKYRAGARDLFDSAWITFAGRQTV